MPAEFPDLSGVATKDLVETIGSGSFKASYINWSRTMNLLRKHAPGWLPELVMSVDGTPVHRASVGGFLLLRFRHIDGTVTPEVPQAIMDHRNGSIQYDKITSRDVTDTHRRGACLVAAMQFGLAYELWAKMPLESGYHVADEETIVKAKEADSKPVPKITKSTKAAEPTPALADKTEFVKLAISMGLCDGAIEELVDKVKSDFNTGIKTLKSKDETFIAQMNAKFQEQY
jgi:hypothetical protein